MPVFRTSPQLGPGLEQHATQWHWDGLGIDCSPLVGNPELGSDGHYYVLVKAGAALAAGADVTINETTWVATAGAGGYEVPGGITGGVAINEYFWARTIALPQ